MKYDFDTYVERRNTASMKWDAYAEGVLPMWVADTDFRSPVQVTDAILEKARLGLFGYPSGNGEFEEACAHWEQTRFGWSVPAEAMTWCPSLGVAIALCVRAFSKPGDGVAMLWPIYPPFMRLCQANGREARGTVLRQIDGKYEIDFDDLEAVLAKPDTTLLLLCNPHNPTGRVFTKEELERIGELCLRHNVTVFSDEIHEDVVYQGRHIPFPSLSPELAAISLVGVNPSKTFNVADLRSACIISENGALLEKFKAEQDSLKLGPCSLGRTGATAAWQTGESYADQLVEYLKGNRDHIMDYARHNWRLIQPCLPEATFLLWLDCRALGMDKQEREKFFVEQARVGLNCGEDFGPGGEGFMRLNFGCPRATLDDGLARITDALRQRQA